MRLLPLTLHAAARLPALTNLLSSTVDVASMTVAAGGKVTITTTTPHGVPVNTRSALCIVDAPTPNPVTHVSVTPVDGNSLVRLTTEHAHDLTGPQWNPTVKLAGFADARLNGNVQLVSVDAGNVFTVLVQGEDISATSTDAEVLLERLEQGIIGWQATTATTTTTLQFDTPADVSRSFTVPSPRVVNKMRIGGSVNLATAQKQHVRHSDQVWMYLVPWGSMRLSKDRNSNSDAMTQRNATSDDRRELIDGYFVYVAFPAESSGGGVTCSDIANGEMLSAVLRTFDGLVLPRREFAIGDSFVHSMIEHGQGLGDYDGATYWHGYSFEVPTLLNQYDMIQPFEWSRINETTLTAASGLGPGSAGGSLIETPITPTGSSVMDAIVFGAADEGNGIFHDDAKQPLTGVVKLT